MSSDQSIDYIEIELKGVAERSFKVWIYELDKFDPLDYLSCFPCQTKECDGILTLNEHFAFFRLMEDYEIPEIGFKVGAWYCSKCHCFLIRPEDMEQIMTIEPPEKQQQAFIGFFDETHFLSRETFESLMSENKSNNK